MNFRNNRWDGLLFQSASWLNYLHIFRTSCWARRPLIGAPPALPIPLMNRLGKDCLLHACSRSVPIFINHARRTAPDWFRSGDVPLCPELIIIVVRWKVCERENYMRVLLTLRRSEVSLILIKQYTLDDPVVCAKYSTWNQQKQVGRPFLKQKRSNATILGVPSSNRTGTRSLLFVFIEISRRNL